MAFTCHVKSLRLHPSAPRVSCPLRLVKARVLNKQRPTLTEDVASSSDISDDERPTASTSGANAARILFEDSHVTSLNPALVLYAPLGVVVATLRSALWILGIALDQTWFRNQAVVDAYLRLLGVQVVWRNPERIPAGCHIMVSNHCSVGDLMMLFSHPRLPQRYTHLITSALPPQVTAARNLPVVMRPASPATYDELAASSSSETSPVHLFPEGGMTNGRGMLRFSRGFMRMLQQQQQQQQPASRPEQPQSLPQHQTIQQQDQTHDSGQVQLQQQHHYHVPQQAGVPLKSREPAAAPPPGLPVVPVALRVRTSLTGISSHTLTSSFLANLFWFSFSPSTTLEATVLPPMSPLPGEARGAFVNRVQAAIAEELGVAVYDMTIQQKRQLLAGRRGS